MGKLDQMIENDMHRYVDGPARKRIEQIKQDLAMWMTVYEMVQNGVFEKSEQVSIGETFGADLLQKLKGFLREIPASEVQETVFNQMKAVRENLAEVIPTSFETEIKRIQEKVFVKFGPQ